MGTTNICVKAKSKRKNASNQWTYAKGFLIRTAIDRERDRQRQREKGDLSRNNDEEGKRETIVFFEFIQRQRLRNAEIFLSLPVSLAVFLRYFFSLEQRVLLTQFLQVTASATLMIVCIFLMTNLSPSIVWDAYSFNRRASLTLADTFSNLKRRIFHWKQFISSALDNTSETILIGINNRSFLLGIYDSKRGNRDQPSTDLPLLSY